MSSKEKRFVWTVSLDTAFVQTYCQVIASSQKNRARAVITGASDKTVGDILKQYSDGQWQPFAFFSKVLHKLERNYSLFDR